MLKILDDYGKTNWVSNVRLLLQSNGFGYVWKNQSVTNPHSFISVFTQRLKDKFIQTCFVIVFICDLFVSRDVPLMS